MHTMNDNSDACSCEGKQQISRRSRFQFYKIEVTMTRGLCHHKRIVPVQIIEATGVVVADEVFEATAPVPSKWLLR